MPRLVQICTCLILAGLALPGVGYLLGLGTSDDYIERVERRRPAMFPGWEDIARFGAWAARFEQAIADRFPFRSAIIETVRSFDRKVGGRRLFGQVSLGRDDWFFFRGDSGRALRSREHIDGFLHNLDHLFEHADRHGVRLVVVAVPPKQFVHDEKLTPGDAELAARFADARDAFYHGLDRFPNGRVPPVWRELRSLRKDSSEFIYHPEDTHYTHLGAMVVARTIVESFAPGLWNPDAVVEEHLITGPGDLAGMAGFSSGFREWEVAVLHIGRPGVTVETADLPSDLDPARSTVRYRTKSELGAALIPGRTLIVHDSFIGGFLRESLARYFADVTYVHSDDLARIDLTSELPQFDRAVLQFNERNALNTATMAVD